MAAASTSFFGSLSCCLPDFFSLSWIVVDCVDESVLFCVPLRFTLESSTLKHMFMFDNEHKRARESEREGKIKRPPQMHEYLKLIRNQWASMSTLHRLRVNLKNSLYSFFFGFLFLNCMATSVRCYDLCGACPHWCHRYLCETIKKYSTMEKKTIIYRKCYTSKSFGRTQNCMRISTVIWPLSFFFSNFMFNSMTKWLDDILSSVFLYLLRNLSDFYIK